MDVDIYRYKYSEDGSAIDFDSLAPAEYTTVIIPLYKIDPETYLPILDEVGDPILATSSATATSETIQEEEWLRTDPETCEEITGECVYDNRTVQSDLTDFGTATSWDIECFNSGNVIVYDGETDIETIAVSAMPVTLQWDDVPNVIEIIGIPDTPKPTPGAVEGGTPTTIIVNGPFGDPPFTTSTVNEFKFKWASGDWQEINADSYVLGTELGNPTWTVTGTSYSSPGGWPYSTSSCIPGGGYSGVLSFNPRISNASGGGWYNNCGLSFMSTVEIIQGSPRDVRGYDPFRGPWPPPGWVSLYGPILTYNPPSTIPYIEFNTGVRVYGGASDFIAPGTFLIDVESGSDTIVTINGVDYYYAEPPAINLYGKRLKVFENGIEIFEGFYDEEFPARLEGTKNITEYKRFIHNASIQFSRQFPGNPVEEWVWFKSGQGQITIDTIEGDCKQEGEFVYDVTTKSGKLGKTTITEQDSDREPGILWKFIEYRPVDDVLDEEVEPELSLTYVFAGGKVYSGIHSKNALVEQTKRVANPSTSHQFSEIGGTPKVSIEDSLSSFTVAAPKEDGANAKWSLDSMPPTIEQQSRDANYAPDGISIGETLDFIGTFDSDPPNVGGSVWQTDWVGLPLDYEGEIDEGLGIQLSNHHEYYVPRKREYRQRNISGWSDAGEWLNGWEPINTVGLSGFLPSGEFRSLSLYHETTRARLQYGIKGCLDTVQGVNGEPLHFAFAYGGIYAAFGKVNDGLDDDNFAMLRTQASTNTTQIFINKNNQTSSNPPVPPSWDIETLMKGYE
ncbi:MAG: hypothetical protein ACO3NK_08600, partial [Prochlorotrichaceae cyanobacterium]